MVDDFGGELTHGADVLDAGCGTGRMIPLLREGGRRVSGVDQSPGMLAQARMRHWDVALAVGSLAALPFAEASFDGILAWYSIIHTPPHELGSVFAEFRRVLRTGGTVLLGYQAGIGDRHIARGYGHELDLPAFLHHTPSVEAMLAAAGFVTRVKLDRGPSGHEKHAQGFVLAQRN